MRMVLVSAGDAITAKLVEQAGFDGIWISGFEASARLGLQDNGSITMNEMLDVARPIVKSVKIPVWVDVDTGYGNFARTVKEFEDIGVAGVCVQDDIPHLKQNSLWGGQVPLMDMKEFGEKLNSAGAFDERKIKIMARTEALIRGYGFDEAGKRMRAYFESGADVIMPHTRDEKFIWSNNKLMVVNYPYENYQVPMAIVPTKFPHYSSQKLFDMGFSMVIWANQTERTKIKAIRECLGSLKGSDCAEYIEANLSATLDEMKGLTE